MREEILVVGGAGYIGSHTAKLLNKKGYQPVILDDLSTGHEPAARFGTFYRENCGNRASVAEIIRKHGIQTVMHFGAKALVGESVQDPLLYYSANTGATVDLLIAMREAGAKNFIFSSTCSTFGEPTQVPIHEGVPQNPVNPYGQSKLFIEKILRDAHAAYGIRSVTLRYFNAAGADPDGELGEDHDPETHLIPKVIQYALGLEKALVVNGNDYPTPDGTCIRDYIHIEDLAEAHVGAMELLRNEDACLDFNLGSETGYSVLEVIREIEKVAGKPLTYRVGPRRPGDPPKLIADSSKARTRLGWSPRHDLHSIVRTAFEWMKKHPKGYDEK